jgi:hypothetical protein
MLSGPLRLRPYASGGRPSSARWEPESACGQSHFETVSAVTRESAGHQENPSMNHRPRWKETDDENAPASRNCSLFNPRPRPRRDLRTLGERSPVRLRPSGSRKRRSPDGNHRRRTIHRCDPDRRPSRLQTSPKRGAVWVRRVAMSVRPVLVSLVVPHEGWSDHGAKLDLGGLTLASAQVGWAYGPEPIGAYGNYRTSSRRFVGCRCRPTLSQ